MRVYLMASLLALAACGGQNAPSGALPKSSVSGWSIAPSGELNGFFDCLENKEIALVAAHRGGPATGFPENAIETFAHTLSAAPALLEIDVATSSDGVPYLMHDDTLERTTTGEGPIDGLSWAEVSALRLKAKGRETAFHPPSLAEALSWAKGRTILEIDFKPSTRYEDVIAEINRQQAEDRVILIAYSSAQAARLHRLSPGAMISLSVSNASELSRTLAAGVPADRLLGFTGVETPNPRLFATLNNQGIEVIFGTLGGRQSIDDEIDATGGAARYAQIAGMGVDIIATDRPAAAQAALETAGRGATDGLCGITRG